MTGPKTERTLLEDYLIRLELVLGAVGDEPIAEILSSRDSRLTRHASELEQLAEEVRSWAPPFGGDDELLTNVTIAGPGGDIGPTAHLDGDAVRFILSGSLWFRGTELGPGDWMFIPSGSAYRLRVGHRGVISLTAVYRPQMLMVREVAGVAAFGSWAE